MKVATVFLASVLYFFRVRQCCGFVTATSRAMERPLALSVDPEEWAELAVAGVLSFAAKPFANRFGIATSNDEKDVEDSQSPVLYAAVDSIAVSARIYVSLKLLDLFQQQYPRLLLIEGAGTKASLIAFTVWAALSAAALKRLLLLRANSGHLGRVSLYDRLIDFVLVLVTLLIILEELSVDISMGLQSVFTAGGVGALIFGVASKDLANNIVGGFTLNAWDGLNEGDEVVLGDGTEGKIRKIGLVETQLVGPDNIVIRIPNGQLTNERVSNLGTVKRSRVKQLLRFKYADLDKLPDVLADIKNEIQCSCPKLITDGSRPFQAILTQYEADHIQAVVKCHFNIPPTSESCDQNRQDVLLAIARAMKKNQVDFALPAIIYTTSVTESDFGGLG